MAYAVPVIVLNLKWRNCSLEYYVFVGSLLILIDFIPLALGLGQSKGNA